MELIWLIAIALVLNAMGNLLLEARR